MDRSAALETYRGFFIGIIKMEFLEKNLEDLIFEADRNLLKERGLNLKGKIKRQLRIGNYGIADLVTIDRGSDFMSSMNITVYELKKDKIGISAFLQATGYLMGIKDYLTKRGFDVDDIVFKIVLIGKEVDLGSTFCYLENLLHFDFLKMYEYKYNLDGLSFEEKEGYVLLDNGFGYE